MQTIPAKTILSGYGNSWFGANYNMNLYKGCCHGCIYCDSRSACYQVTDFDTVRAKANALFILEKDLRSKKRKGIIMAGAMSDSYNPFEATEKLTAGTLELINKYRFGVVLGTKSDLVLRDTDTFLRIREHSPAFVNFTVTTADDALCRKIEPNVCPTSRRIAALKELGQAGVEGGIQLMPILPFINDTPENITVLWRWQPMRVQNTFIRQWESRSDKISASIFLTDWTRNFPELKSSTLENSEMTMHAEALA